MNITEYVNDRYKNKVKIEIKNNYSGNILINLLLRL